MGKDYTTVKKSRLVVSWLIVVILAILCLVIPEYLHLIRGNRSRVYKASEVLIHEVQQIIDSNRKEKDNLDRFLNNTYINKARTVSFVVDAMPYIEYQPQRLQRLADLIDVDEIHLFNEEGVLYSGSKPQYYGLTLDSGPQIAYFKPMLRDRSRCMSQNFLPKDAEGKGMLYSMCWDEGKTKMIQVGADGERFPDILYESSIETIIGRIPTVAGTKIILADVVTDRIIAATDNDSVGKKLENIGIFLPHGDFRQKINFSTGFRDQPIYCSVENYSDYRIVIAQYRNVVDESVPSTLVTFTGYLVLIFCAVSILLNSLYNRVIKEKNWAEKDKLTDLFNRREYENTLETYSTVPLEENLIFVSLDVNGLKNINDLHGHAAGDRVLQGAAGCIQRCFGPYGKTFRYGGDEFVAIVYTDQDGFDRIRKKFDEELKLWSEQNGILLHLSLGAVRTADYPHVDIYKLANIADQKMYRAKAAYYATHKDRRRPEHLNIDIYDEKETSKIKKNDTFLTY